MPNLRFVKRIECIFSPRNDDSCRKRGRAFTLVEILIATALILLVVTMALAAGNAISSSWGRLTTESEQFRELLALDRTMETMLSNIIPFKWQDEDGEPILVFHGGPNWLSFAYRHRVNNLEEGAIRFAGFQVSNNKLQALYQSRPLLRLDAPGANVRWSTLADGVSRLRCRYAVWEDDDIVWKEQWNTAEKRGYMPIGVRLDVFWKDGRREVWVRRVAGNGYYEKRTGYEFEPES